MPAVNPLFPPLAVMVIGVVDDCGETVSGRLFTGAGGGELGSGREDGGRCVEPFEVISCQHPGAEGVVIAQLVRSVRLQAVGEIAVVHLRRVAGQKKVLHRVRSKTDVRISGKGGNLAGKVARGFLIGEHRVIILLVLVFVDRGRVGRRAVRQLIGRRKPRRVGNLKARVGTAQKQGQPAGWVEAMGEVTKELFLVRHIMQRIGAGRRVVNAEVVVQIGGGDEVVQIARGAAPLAGRD